MRVSVICTVLNEGETIRRLLESLCSQTRPPDEVLFVDGGSTDNTLAVLRSYAERLPLRIIEKPGANIAEGRNAAIAAASGDVIASTDAGVWLEPCWLDALTAPLRDRHDLQAVAGFFVADPATPFEVAMGATVLPHAGDITPATFLPSSRSVAFRKAAWSTAGGYPEWLDYCEDLIFDFRLRAAAGAFAWAPDAVAHFRPRGSLAAFARQYYRYARGDGKADLWRKRHAIRYATYLVALPALLWLATLRHRTQTFEVSETSKVCRLCLNVGAALCGRWWQGRPQRAAPTTTARSVKGTRGFPGGAVALILGLCGAAAYCAAPYRRLLPHLPAMSARERVYALALVPVIRIVGDIAKMAGYPTGWAWRIRNWQRREIHWRADGTS